MRFKHVQSERKQLHTVHEHHLASTIPLCCLKSGWDISQAAQVLRKLCLNYACKHSMELLDAQAHSMTIGLPD